MTKYLSFAPYYSGFSNILMNYEAIFATAYITKRTVVLPPNVWSLFISPTKSVKDYVDIWEVFDRKKVEEEFDCIDFYKVPEFQGKYLIMDGHNHIIDKEKLNKFSKNHVSYTKNIEYVINDIKCIDFIKENPKELEKIEYAVLCDSKCVLVNQDFSGNEDFEEFRQNRKIINLSNYTEKFLHFEDNMFGHYWYSIYPGNCDERNKMKEVINKCFRYNDRIYHLAEKVINTIGQYNAIHVRRSDFLETQTKSLEPVSSGEKLKKMVEIFLDPSMPLYVATDEEDKSFFDELKSKYKVYFYKDFNYELTNLDHAVIEQVICANAHKFYGTYHSTYTKRINVMRGIENKQADDDMGINYYPFDNRQDVITANPWKLRNDKLWHWNDSSHPQWKIEKNGKYY